MLNKNSFNLRILLPHFLLLGAILLFLLVKEAPPRVTSITEELSSNGSFSLTWNKSLKTDNLEGKVEVMKNNQLVIGTLKATPVTIVFTPENPWSAGETYTVKISSLPSARGDIVSEPLESSFTIQKEKIIFLSPDDRLVEGDPETGETKLITPDNIEISDFSLGPDGSFAALYIPKEDSHANGLLFGKYEKGKYELTLLPAEKETSYSHLRLCNGGQQLLLNASEKNGIDALQYYDLLWGKNETKITKGWKINGALTFLEEDAACSQDTARVVYMNSNGAYVSSFLGESGEDLVGVFDLALGFSPRDTTLAFQKSLTENNDTRLYRSELSLYSANGEVFTLSELDTIFEEMSWNGNGNRFAVLYIASEEYFSRVEVYDQKKSAWEKILTIPASKERRITHQALSLDGSVLAFETAPEENIRIPADHPEIHLWNLIENKESAVTFPGKSPQWKK